MCTDGRQGLEPSEDVVLDNTASDTLASRGRLRDRAEAPVLFVVDDDLPTLELLREVAARLWLEQRRVHAPARAARRP